MSSLLDLFFINNLTRFVEYPLNISWVDSGHAIAGIVDSCAPAAHTNTTADYRWLLPTDIQNDRSS